MAGTGVTLRPASALGAAAFLALAAGLVVSNAARQRALSLTPEDLVAADRVALVGELPRDPALLGAMGARFERSLFPPDLAAAHAATARRIAIEPFDSPPWLRLARLHFRMGRPAEALAALRVSDRLKPGFPDERLDAIQLWALLGERDRARDLAAAVAALGDAPSLLAARELRMLDWDAADALAAVTPERSPVAQAKAAVLFFGTDADANAAVFAALPRTAVSEPEARRVLLEASLSPLLPEMAVNLWRVDAMPRVAAAELPGGTILLDSPTLGERPPLRGPLGWQLSEDATYRSEDGAGSLRVLMQNPRGFSLPVYRMIVPAGVSGEVTLDVEVDAVAPARVRLSAADASGEFVAADGRVRVRAPLPARDEAAVVDVVLACTPADQKREFVLTEVRIRGISIGAAP